MRYERLTRDRCDLDQLAATIDGSDIRHRVLPGGDLSVDLEKVVLADGTLQRGRYGMGVLAQGAWPKGRVTIGVVLRSPAEATVNGLVCPELSVQLYPEGGELTYRAPPGATWCVYYVERSKLEAAILRLHGRPLPVPASGAISVRPDPAAARRIAASVESAFVAGASRAAVEGRDPGAGVEARLQFDLACVFGGAGGAASARDQLRAEQRRRIMTRAEEYLRANLSQPFNLRALASAVGTSHRMLEHHFRRTYGVSPLTWHRSMRLDTVRRDLRRAYRNGESVTAIAMRWGFHHLGRFSEEYRRLFGERPVDTLRRA